MMHIKRLYQQLTTFLNSKAENRREITEWYDDLYVDTPISLAEQDSIRRRAKERIEYAIKREPVSINYKRIYGWSAAAAVAVLSGYFVWSTFYKMDVATHTDLAQVAPAKERAIIVLEDGKEIDLDQLAMNQRIQVGQIIISKDEQGKVSYHDASSGKEKVQINSLHVPKAATYQLTLVDGTRVTLNSDSKLTYPSSFGAGDRIVQLDGEGYFEVSKTSNKSKFIVQANKQRIQVLGTKFNVKSYSQEDKEQTTLAEGSVHVSIGTNSTMLVPDQQASSTGQSLEKKTVDVEDVLSWTKGQFCFDGTNTEEVLREVARWYDIEINYKRKEGAAQYTGKIPRNLSLDKLIELLNYAELKTHAQIGSNKRINLTIT